MRLSTLSFINHGLMLATLIFLVVVPKAQSDDTLHVFTGAAEGDWLGYSVASAGDVNHDGYADLFVGEPGNNSQSSVGRAFVFSGLNGDTLYSFVGEAAGDQFGGSVASAGDVNNDGYADLIVGAIGNDASASDGGRAYVFSGLNGDTLHVFNGEETFNFFGWSVATAGDVNKDGYADLIVGAVLNDAGGTIAGKAYVYSGLNGNTLHTFTGEASFAFLGWSVASAGDVNKDGHSDIIMGAIGSDGVGPNAGRAYVFSGKTGDTLHIFTGEAAGDSCGFSVSSAGDVNNDGYADVIVGAGGNDVGGVDAGRAYVFCGKTGDTLHIFTGEAAGDALGSSVSSAGDFNKDGYSDIIVGAVGYDAGVLNVGRAYVFSGLNGDTLKVFTGEAAGDKFGNSVASSGDVNKDSFGDLIVAARLNDAGGADAGRVYVYSGALPSSSCCIGSTGNVDGDGGVDIADLTFLIDHLFINFPDVGCSEEGNIDGAGGTDIADLTFLIDHLFINFPDLPACP